MHSFKLGIGNHPGRTDIGCVNEIASQLAGVEWSDHPSCVDPVITPLAIWYNDSFSSDDALNADEFARSLPWRMVGTVATKEISQQRAKMAAKWANEVVVPFAAKYAAESAAKYAEYAAKYAAESAAKYAEYAAKYAAESAAKSAKYAAESAAESAEYESRIQLLRESCAELLTRMIELTEVKEQCVVVKCEEMPAK